MKQPLYSRLVQKDYPCLVNLLYWLVRHKSDTLLRLSVYFSTVDECAALAEGCKQERNTQGSTIDWRFTTDDVRIKLKRLYPHSRLTSHYVSIG